MNRTEVRRVVFLGAPSTGKTSLCKALAAHYDTTWMPEYGREYWMQHQQDRRLSPEQLVEIAEGHIEREDRLLGATNRFLFVDTEAIITYHFALDYHGDAHPRLKELADASKDRYDAFFLCESDIPYDDTWERSGAQHRRVVLHGLLHVHADCRGRLRAAGMAQFVEACQDLIVRIRG